MVSPLVLSHQGDTYTVKVVAGGAAVFILSAFSIRIKSPLPETPISPGVRSLPTRYWQLDSIAEKLEHQRKPGKTKKEGMVQGLRWALVAIGLFIFVLGVLQLGDAMSVNCIITGLMTALLSFIMAQIGPLSGPMRLFAKDGSVLMEASSIDWADGNILIKGKVLGSITTTAYFKPDEMWKSLSLVSPSIIMHIPSYLFKGWHITRTKKS